MKKARDYVYSNGTLWERAAFAYLFEEGDLNRLHQSVLCYKNADNGFGHGMEHDIKTPDSHPLGLEYILGVFVRDWDIPAGNVFAGAAQWVEANQQDDGTLTNPASLHAYPYAPWWKDGGQTAPDSIVGNLTALGLVTPTLAEKTRQWVHANLTIDKICENGWLFMAYHAFDYFMHVDDFPDVTRYRQATIDNIRDCARKAPEEQYGSLLMFAPTPDSVITKAMPELVTRDLEYVLQAQQDDGRWKDQHDLAHWQPATTITALRMLERHGKLNG